MSDLSEVKLYQLATAAQQATEAACAKFAPFEGLALSIQLKKLAKAIVAHITEAYGRYNAPDRIRLLTLATEASDQVLRALDAAAKSRLFDRTEYDALMATWMGVVSEMNDCVEFLQNGGEMESPLPGV